MIREPRSRKSHLAITSDTWHVVHARWSGQHSEAPRFVRTIVSEHADRVTATAAARDLVSRLSQEMYLRPHGQRDQIFVRRPAYKSLKTAARVRNRRR